MAAATGSTTLSVVIPCWNDASALREILSRIALVRGVTEVVVADASTAADCRNVATAAGARVVCCPRPNRGAQMNQGAQMARSDLLLFQHADTELTQPHIDSLHSIAQDPTVIGGAFHRKFDSRHARLRWLEPVARRWADHGGTLYGDQSIFVRRSVFNELGGFADIPLMEDLEFSRRLRRSGRVVLLDPPIASSPRHAEQHGPWRTSIRNGLFIALFHAGVSPETLHRWYYRIHTQKGRTGASPSPAPVTTDSPVSS